VSLSIHDKQLIRTVSLSIHDKQLIHTVSLSIHDKQLIRTVSLSVHDSSAQIKSRFTDAANSLTDPTRKQSPDLGQFTYNNRLIELL